MGNLLWRSRVALIASVCMLVAGRLAVGAESARSDSLPLHPNILWICTDQQRWDTIHALGNEHIRTPNLDRLCGEGVAFTHAFCQSPICTPSRAAFLTGMYPRYLNACTNGNETWQNEAPLITKTLADLGYDCGLAGKLHLSAAHNRIEPRPDDGYRVFQWSHHPHDSWPEGHAYNDWLKSKGIDHTATKKRLGYIPSEIHQTTWCTDRAIDFIKEERSGPWLFSLNCFDPHPPLDPPKEYLDRFDLGSLPVPDFADVDLDEEAALAGAGVNFQSKARRIPAEKARLDLAKYWAMIELIDDNVGRLMTTLNETGQREKTIIIFTSDHGHMIGDHGLVNKGCRFYEGLVRVPLIVSWPGRFESDLRCDALVELIDITPTLLELAGQSIPENMHGRSLLPLLTGEADSHREFARCTFTDTLQGPKSRATMIRDRRHKLIAYHGTKLGQLFDLEADPNEHHNLWDSTEHAAVKGRLLMKSFDAEVMSVDEGSHRVGRY
jgi:arylsulfatase